MGSQQSRHVPSDRGQCEVEVICEDEADLQSHLKDCRKSQSHKKFIPVKQFTMKNLPRRYRKKQVMDLIRAMSDLTVRVSVNYVSDKRPQTWPDSDEPYPSYGRSQNTTRVGTGCVKSVTMNSEVFGNIFNQQNTCPCRECFGSQKPRTEFARLVIVTATHVVYDDLEAAHTTCHLFFDHGGTPETCKGVVTLNDMSRLRCDTASDWTEMTYVTHNMDLIHRLKHIEDSFFQGIKYLLATSNVLPQARNKTLAKIISHLQDCRPLTVMVSHPHGCSKQISLGYCTNIDDEYLETKEYTYTTATCPGSSGARVFIMERDYLEIRVEFVHSGSYRNNVNYCKYVDHMIIKDKSVLWKLREYSLLPEYCDVIFV